MSRSFEGKRQESYRGVSILPAPDKKPTLRLVTHPAAVH